MTLGYSLVSKCPACSSSSSISHWFLHCSFAGQVWNQCMLLFHVQFFFHSSLWDFFQDCWGGLSMKQQGSQLFLLPGLVCWELWKARCSFLYDDQPFSVARVIHSIQFQLNVLRTTSFSRRVVVPFSVVWHFPPSPYVKVNADGSARGNPGLAGVGVVIRNSFGGTLAAAYEAVGSHSNNEAEILAVHRGVQLALCLGYQQIVVDSDSLLLVQWLYFKIPWPWKLYHLLRMIPHLIRESLLSQ